jgi:hypothetical protein
LNCFVKAWPSAKTTTPSCPPETAGPAGNAADKLSVAIIEKRLNYWTWLLGPKFSEKGRPAVNLRRDYSIHQIEYCRNSIFRRHFPIHKIFERSC